MYLSTRDMDPYCDTVRSAGREMEIGEGWVASVLFRGKRRWCYILIKGRALSGRKSQSADELL